MFLCLPVLPVSPLELSTLDEEPLECLLSRGEQGTALEFYRISILPEVKSSPFQSNPVLSDCQKGGSLFSCSFMGFLQAHWEVINLDFKKKIHGEICSSVVTSFNLM